ncbi:TPA: Slam-dependent surface lipoprotein [Neisseria meningitidis]|uniref:Slam-dependent surface lipoprotein n=1 Tax=Neisseria meningitidis TaxID=487 RepID=UPI000C33236A|nr:Slam-dependent surface lipoprotein [Neisseria meningitidis]MBG8970117.1 hemoglobin-haptoglobin-utilization protein [Neisseria meningitidis]QPH76496.1 hemoglobin-haptoglobin-utilization protein [Neisseria meningitidis]QPL07491.1 transferrin-binding protein-like solute binding protein [Neisseria meningitidis]
MKYKALSLLPLAAALAACAGGGVAEPHIPVSIPTATPLPTGEVKLSDDNSKIENINTAGTGSTSGISIQQREVEKEPFPGYKTKETSFIFQTPGGAQYALSSYADPITVSYSSPDFKIPDRHAGQRLADGSRIFICCSESGATSYAEITKQDYMKFGAWIGPNGEIDLFAGGFPVGKTPKPAYSWSDDTPETQGKGKITYQVWGIRVKDGQFVTSSYTPPKGSSFTGYTNTPVLSFITANFNSNKLAGKILGNSDYGPDVEIKEATINGLTFSGTATSGGQTGNLDGKFFGKFDSSYSSDTSIGGKITFDGDRSLDTVFGGVSYEKQLEDTTNQDTEHLKKQ